jgi:hypothetical protein
MPRIGLNGYLNSALRPATALNPAFVQSRFDLPLDETLRRFPLNSEFGHRDSECGH